MTIDMKSGRYEHESKLREKTKRTVMWYPDYVSIYMNNFTDKTAATQYVYIHHVCRFIDFIAEKYGKDSVKADNLKEIKPYHIVEFINSKDKITNSSKEKIVYALKDFFKFLKDNGFIDKDPAGSVLPPKDKTIHKVVAMNKDDIEYVKKRILISHNGTQGKKKLDGIGENEDTVKTLTPKKQALVDRDMAIFDMGILTGMRITEIIDINISDINWEDKTIKIIQKGGSERYVCFSDRLEEALRRYLNERHYLEKEGKENDALFLSTRGTRITYVVISKMMKNWTEGLDKHITPHKMRSTFATALYNETGDIYLTGEALGHRNVQNTMRYAKASKEKMEEAAKVVEDII